MMSGVVLFEGSDLKVTLQDRSDGPVVVTFTEHHARYPIAEGFGDRFLEKQGIASVSFISKANHWWQTAEMHQAIDLVRKHSAIASRRKIGYGSSMGAYGAILFAS